MRIGIASGSSRTRSACYASPSVAEPDSVAAAHSQGSRSCLGANCRCDQLHDRLVRAGIRAAAVEERAATTPGVAGAGRRARGACLRSNACVRQTAGGEIACCVELAAIGIARNIAADASDRGLRRARRVRTAERRTRQKASTRCDAGESRGPTPDHPGAAASGLFDGRHQDGQSRTRETETRGVRSAEVRDERRVSSSDSSSCSKRSHSALRNPH